MSNQITNINEPLIHHNMDEDQAVKGTFNSIYNFVVNQSDDSTENRPNPLFNGENIQYNPTLEVEEDKNVPSDVFIQGVTNQGMKRPLKLQQNIDKSREIYKYIQSKKNAWKPNETGLAYLKHHFEKNQHPTDEEKDAMLKKLENSFNSDVDIKRINNWFRNEREKTARRNYKNLSKNTYQKFRREDLEFLKVNFAQNNYPKTEEMMTMGKRLGVSLSKIENWYKHSRRAMAKKGYLTLKTKKHFKKSEVNYLMKMLETYPRPSKEQLMEIAKHLDCSELQIKNWYSNKRKKQKLMAKKQLNSQETGLHYNNVSNFDHVDIQSSDMNKNSFGNNQNLLLANSNFTPYNQPFQTVPVLNANKPANNYQIPVNSSALLAPNFQPVNVNQGFANYSVLPNNFINGMNGAQPVIIMAVPANTQPSSIIANGNNVQVLNPFKQNVNTIEASKLNMIPQSQIIPQNQIIQQSNPIFILANNNKVQGAQQPTILNAPTQTINVMPNTFAGNNLIQSGIINNNNGSTGIAPYTSPIQVQYLTNLYSPYSNTNTYNNFYPIVYQNTPNYVVSTPNKVIGDHQGNTTLLPQQVPSFGVMENGLSNDNISGFRQ